MRPGWSCTSGSDRTLGWLTTRKLERKPAWVRMPSCASMPSPSSTTCGPSVACALLREATSSVQSRFAHRKPAAMPSILPLLPAEAAMGLSKRSRTSSRAPSPGAGTASAWPGKTATSAGGRLRTGSGTSTSAPAGGRGAEMAPPAATTKDAAPSWASASRSRVPGGQCAVKVTFRPATRSKLATTATRDKISQPRMKMRTPLLSSGGVRSASHSS
mmetsp:Transcript_112021/g.316912  ORF Transcript_112021/g.316912 Transcript_112021/m.316912 type:complete len:216 (-) Transcript_112021:1701-2348(-)